MPGTRRARRSTSTISGIPGHPSEDVSLSKIDIAHQGGALNAKVNFRVELPKRKLHLA